MRNVKIEVNLLFFAVLLMVILIGYSTEYIIISLSMLVHEAGHTITAVILGKKVYSIRVLPVGINANFSENTLFGRQNIIIYIAGPIVNIILSLAGLIVYSYCLQDSNDMLFFITANLYLAIFNLLPVIPMDGGMIIREILWGHIGFFSAKKYLKRINRALAFSMMVLGLFQLISSSWNFSMIIIGIFVFFSYCDGRMEVSFMNVKSIIYRRARLLKKGVYQSRDLVVIKSVHMGEIIKHMDFDRFHIVYVLNDDLSVMEVLTEQDIIDGLLRYNPEITFEDYLKAEKKS